VDTGAYTGAGATRGIAYTQIKAHILLGSLPLGERLREERLAERLGVSRTPVREALHQLFAERFVERHPDGGYRIAYPTSRHLRELYEVRRALEAFAVRQSVQHLSDAGSATLADLHEEWSALATRAPERDPEFVLLDEAFHRRLAEAAGNELLVDDLRRVSERIRPVRTHDFVAPGRIAATVAEHTAIVAAVLERSPEAEELLDQHIMQSQRIVESALGSVIQRMVNKREEMPEW